MRFLTCFGAVDIVRERGFSNIVGLLVLRAKELTEKDRHNGEVFLSQARLALHDNYRVLLLAFGRDSDGLGALPSICTRCSLIDFFSHNTVRKA